MAGCNGDVDSDDGTEGGLVVFNCDGTLDVIMVGFNNDVDFDGGTEGGSVVDSLDGTLDGSDSDVDGNMNGCMARDGRSDAVNDWSVDDGVGGNADVDVDGDDNIDVKDGDAGS